MEVTYNQLKKSIQKTDKPLLVEFWGSWCPPCKMMEPILADLEKKHQNNLKIIKINTDQNPKTKTEYSINGLPTFILFKEGREQKRLVGAQSHNFLEKIIKE